MTRTNPVAIKLSTRLRAIYEELLSGQEVWDMACDHGLLGLQALVSRTFPRVHFVDPVMSIIKDLEKKLAHKAFLSLRENAKIHQCLASQVSEEIRGTLCLAGVGANTILSEIEILAGQKNLQAEKIILSPHKDVDVFLSRLEREATKLCQSYKFTKQIKILERGRERSLFIFTRNSITDKKA